MDEPIGAASVANAIVAVMPHFVEFLYSYGLSTSGVMAILAKSPLLWDRGTIVTARERVDDGRDELREAVRPGGASAPVGSPEVLTDGTAASPGKPFSMSRTVSVSVVSTEAGDAGRSISSRHRCGCGCGFSPSVSADMI